MEVQDKTGNICCVYLLSTVSTSVKAGVLTDFAAVLPAKSSVLYRKMMSFSNACYDALSLDYEIQERSGLYQSEEIFLGYRLYIMLSFGRKYFIERTIIVLAVALAWICFMLGSSAASIVR